MAVLREHARIHQRGGDGGGSPRLSVFATSSASARRVSRGAAQGAQGQRRRPAARPTQRKLEPERQLAR